MGQQQLLLIVLGVIVVGIAVVVGINLFNANAESSTQDSLVSQGTNLGAMAQQYYKKPVAMGGGGQAFDNSKGGAGFGDYWTNSIPSTLKTTADATWSAPTVAAASVNLTATPNTDLGYSWTVETTITPTTITSKVVTP